MICSQATDISLTIIVGLFQYSHFCLESVHPDALHSSNAMGAISNFFNLSSFEASSSFEQLTQTAMVSKDILSSATLTSKLASPAASLN